MTTSVNSCAGLLFGLKGESGAAQPREEKLALLIKGVGEIQLHGSQTMRDEACGICFKEKQVVRDAHPGWHAYCLACLSSIRSCPTCRFDIGTYYRPDLGSDMRPGAEDDAADEMPEMIRLEPRSEILRQFISQPELLNHGVYAHYRKDKDFILEGYKFNHLVLVFASPDLFNDADFMLKAIRINPSAAAFAGESVVRNERFLSMVEHNSNN